MDSSESHRLILRVFIVCFLASLLMLGWLLWPFLSIIGGLKLFGILGIFYGPLVVTAFLTLTDIYESSYQILVDPEKEAPGGAA